MEHWYGWKNGLIVAKYPSRSIAERALDRPFAQRTIDAISPVPAGGNRGGFQNEALLRDRGVTR